MQLDAVYNKLIEEDQYKDVAFIKVDANNRANQEFTTHYQVRFVPTIFTYNSEGETILEIVGPLTEDSFRKSLDDILK